MRIQAIATLTTAAAVSFFGLQDPEQSPGTSPEGNAANPAIFGWETGTVETGKVERYQNDSSSLNEPDPFKESASGSFPVSPPALPDAGQEPIFLAENTDDGIIDFAAMPELVDLAKQVEVDGIDNVSEMVGPAIPGLTEAGLVSAGAPAPEIDSEPPSEGLAEILENAGAPAPEIDSEPPSEGLAEILENAGAPAPEIDSEPSSEGLAEILENAGAPAPEIDSEPPSEGLAEILENAEVPALENLASIDPAGEIIEPGNLDAIDLDLVQSDNGDVPSLDLLLDDIAPAPVVVAAAAAEGLDSPRTSL